MSIEAAIIEAAALIAREGGCPDSIECDEDSLRKLLLSDGFSESEVQNFLDSLPDGDK